MTLPELQAKREAVKLQKADVTQQIITLNGQMHGQGRLPSSVWNDLHARKDALVRQNIRLEAELTALTGQIRRQTQEEYEANRQSKLSQSGEPSAPPQLHDVHADKRAVIISLNNLRQHYQQFAADTTRVRSKRDMAAEFVVKLSDIIRASIAAK